MKSLNGNIFRVTGLLCGEFTTQRPATRNFDVLFDLRLDRQLSKNGDAGELRRHRAHFDVIVVNLHRDQLILHNPVMCFLLKWLYNQTWLDPYNQFQILIFNR